MGAERVLLVVNPAAAGGRTGALWPSIQTLLKRAGCAYDYRLTERAGHATVLAEEAGHTGCGLVVAVGGDGTVNEVANGLMAVSQRPTLGIIPTGRGHDFARTLGLPTALDEACRRPFQDRDRLVDVGEVEYGAGGEAQRRFFLNAAGLGFEGEVVARSHRGSGPGTMGYLVTLLTALWSYQNQPMRIRLDDQQSEAMVSNLTVCNGRYYGGGMCIAPRAQPDDGLLDVVMLGDVSRLELLVNLPRLYRGTHLAHPKVAYHQVREVEVQSLGRARLQADGDPCGEAPAVFRVLPGALRVRG